MTNINVYLEIGKKKVFASAMDWPGWSRAGRSEEQALLVLLDCVASEPPTETDPETAVSLAEDGLTQPGATMRTASSTAARSRPMFAGVSGCACQYLVTTC